MVSVLMRPAFHEQSNAKHSSSSLLLLLFIYLFMCLFIYLPTLEPSLFGGKSAADVFKVCSFLRFDLLIPSRDSSLQNQLYE